MLRSCFNIRVRSPPDAYKVRFQTNDKSRSGIWESFLCQFVFASDAPSVITGRGLGCKDRWCPQRRTTTARDGLREAAGLDIDEYRRRGTMAVYKE